MVKKLTIFTIGHSTRPLKDFIALLEHYAIKRVVDVRTIARSKHNPQFNEEHLKKMLPKAGIKYTHMKGLGGLRHPLKDSINTAWHNASFRGYADYMQTDDFKKNIKKLLAYAKKSSVVIMCAEAVPWRCHRSLIGDALLVRKCDVEDVYSMTSVKPHELTSWASVHGTEITYPASKVRKSRGSI